MDFRRYFQISAFFVVVSAGTAALWLRSEFAGDELWLRKTGSPSTQVEFRSFQGRLELQIHRGPRAVPEFSGGYGKFDCADFDDFAAKRLPNSSGTFSYHRDQGYFFFYANIVEPGGWSMVQIRWPHWLALALEILLIAVTLRRFTIQAKSRGPFACSRCGYDLRVSNNRCPECGRLIAPARESAARQSGAENRDSQRSKSLREKPKGTVTEKPKGTVTNSDSVKSEKEKGSEANFQNWLLTLLFCPRW
jgi:hypothetical protein